MCSSVSSACLQYGQHWEVIMPRWCARTAVHSPRQKCAQQGAFLFRLKGGDAGTYQPPVCVIVHARKLSWPPGYKLGDLL